MGHPIVADEIYGDNTPLLLSAIKKKNFKLSKDEEEERPDDEDDDDNDETDVEPPQPLTLPSMCEVFVSSLTVSN